MTEIQAAAPTAWRCVTVGVESIEVALKLWRDTLGFEPVATRKGPDAELARLWDIKPTDIHQQALLYTPGNDVGGLHLVEFQQPGIAVRKGAEVFDLCPKNLDIYVDDLPRRIEELKRQGLTFRNSQYSEVEAPDGTTFREIHLPSHDNINVVLLQVLGEDHTYTQKGFAGVGPLIAIVDSAEKEKRFFSQALSMQMLTENLLSGPEVEKMVGLPAGAQLDISIWGAKGQHFGQMELIEYRGVEGTDLYPRANPPAPGVLHVNYQSDNLADALRALSAANAEVKRIDGIDVLPGSGSAISLRSPAGLRIDIFSK